MNVVRCASALVLVQVAACDEEAQQASQVRWTAALRDSAGIQIVENARPAWTRETAWQVEPEPAIVIKSDDSAAHPEFILFNTGDVVRLSDGTIVIENRGANELLVFGPRGDFLESWGRKGEGPGEFDDMMRLFKCGGDTLVVQEYNRATVIDRTGKTVRVVSRRRDLSISGRVIFHGLASDCNASLWGTFGESIVDDRRGTRVTEYTLLWVPLESGSADTVGTVIRYEFSLDGRELPFSLLPDWTTNGVDVYYGVGDRPEIAILRRNGSIRRLIRWPARRAAITEADWTRYERDFEIILRFDPRMTSRRVTRELLPYDSMPSFASNYLGGGHDGFLKAFLLDDSNYLWVRKYLYVPASQRLPNARLQIATQEWWIFDERGYWMGEVVTPSDLIVKAVSGGLLFGKWEDEFGAEEIHVYRIVKPAGPE